MAAPNLVNASAVYGKSANGVLTTSNADILANAAASGKVLKVNSLYVSNVDGAASVDATITYYNAGAATTRKLTNTIPVPQDATLVVIDKHAPIYLEEGDKIEGLASANSDAEWVVSYEEMS